MTAAQTWNQKLCEFTAAVLRSASFSRLSSAFGDNILRQVRCMEELQYYALVYESINNGYLDLCKNIPDHPIYFFPLALVSVPPFLIILVPGVLFAVLLFASVVVSLINESRIPLFDNRFQVHHK